MTAPGDGGAGRRALGRRSVLGALGTALASGVAVPAAAGARTPVEQGSDGPEGEGYAVAQGDRCSRVVPLAGDEPVESLYGYRGPGRDGGGGNAESDTDTGDEGADASEGSAARSHGTTGLRRRDATVTFLYDGPGGLSLVVLHDCATGSDGTGGAVSWTLEGVPADAEWAVRDDPGADTAGDATAADHDCWNVDGDVHSVDWSWAAGDTDGGALRTAGPALDLTVRPAFNEAAARWDDGDAREPIREWTFLSFPDGRDAPERTALALDEPVVVRRGACETSGRDSDDREDVIEVDLRLAASSLLVERRAAVPVELLPDEPLDPDQVVTESLRLGPPDVVDAGGGASPVGGASDDDLVYHFPLDDLGDTEFKLVGRTTDGRRIVGTAGFSPPDFDPFGSGGGGDGSDD